tara:strand:+ start:5837 stop:6745 length:909 start_codon:yes stop_codon:yes gene_type:complete
MIGEIPSVILLVNSIFLFNKYRYFSLTLISFSIFFGKLLNVIPFLIFYIVLFYIEKDLKKVINDAIIFSIPFIFWLGLVNFNYESGNLQDYITDLYNLISNHQSSGISREGSIFSLSNFVNSEASSWNSYELVRILFAPLSFFFILIRNRIDLINFFGNIIYPLAISTLCTYMWFWFLSPTKWMRYSQHFVIVILISAVYFINFEIIKSKLDLFIISSMLFLYIDNEKSLIFFGIFSLIYLLFLSKRKFNYSIISYLITFIVLVDLFIPFLNTNTQSNLEFRIESCAENLISDNCFREYESN